MVPTEPALPEVRNRLTLLRHSLLRLHKILLDSERATFERVRGPIVNSGMFFDLVLNDGWFAWLRPISQLIVAMDEALDAKEPASKAELDSLIEKANQLMRPNESGDTFGRSYHQAIQRDPEVVIAHCELAKLLSVERKAAPKAS